MHKNFDTPQKTPGGMGHSQADEEWMKKSYFDTTWLTETMAKDINQRLESGYRPIIFMETNRYDSSIYSIISKKVRYLREEKGLEIYIKSNTYKDDKFEQLLIFIGGKDCQEFYKEFCGTDVNKILPKIVYAPALSRMFWVDHELSLWNFQNLHSYTIFRDKDIPTVKAPEFYSHPQQLSITEQFAETKTQEEQPQEEPQEIKPEKKQMKGWGQIMAERKANPIKRTPIKKHKRLITGYEKRFGYLLARYGQSYDALLLPMPKDIQEQFQEKAKQDQETLDKIKQDRETMIREKNYVLKPYGDGSRVSKKDMTPEQLKEYNQSSQQHYKHQSAVKEELHLANLSPEDREAYIARKKAVRKEQQARYRQNAKARKEAEKQALSGEELAIYEAEEEQQKEILRAKNREIYARRKERERAKKEQEEQEKLAKEKAEQDAIINREKIRADAKKSCEIRNKVAKRKAEREAEQEAKAKETAENSQEKL